MPGTALPQPILRSPGAKINFAIALCCTVFIIVLALSAYGDRSIRVLHVFESLPYLLAGVLCLRYSKFGYALGFAGGALWLWMAGILTTFVRNGFERMAMLINAEHVDQPEIMLAVPAALATAGLVLFSLWGYVLLSKRWIDIGIFVLAVLFMSEFYVGIFAAFAPQYLGMFNKVLR